MLEPPDVEVVGLDHLDGEEHGRLRSRHAGERVDVGDRFEVELGGGADLDADPGRPRALGPHQHGRHPVSVRRLVEPLEDVVQRHRRERVVPVRGAGERRRVDEAECDRAGRRSGLGVRRNVDREGAGIDPFELGFAARDPDLAVDGGEADRGVVVQRRVIHPIDVQQVEGEDRAGVGRGLAGVVEGNQSRLQ